MATSSLLPTHPGKALHWHNVPGACQARMLSQAVQTQDGLVVALCKDMYRARQLYDDCQFFLAHCETHYPIVTLPDWEILPYDHFSPHQDIVSERLKTLATSSTLKQGLFIVPITTALQRLAPQQHVHHVFALRTGEHLARERFREQLVDAGYYAVSEVRNHGEFAVRGSVVDLFPMGHNTPIRIDCFDDEIESIRCFSPETQRSQSTINHFELLPAFEYPLTEAAISRFRSGWRDTFSGDPLLSPVYQHISDGKSIGGIEYYLPLFFETTDTLFDYLPTNACYVLDDDIRAHAQTFLTEVTARFEQRRGDITRPLLPPNALYLSHDELLRQLKQHLQIQCHEFHSTQKPAVNGWGKPLPDLTVLTHTTDNRFTKLKHYLDDHNRPCLIVADSRGRGEQLRTLLSRESLHAERVKDWQCFSAQQPMLALTHGPLHQGFIDEQHHIIIVSENDLLGEPVYQHKKRRAQTISPEHIFKSLAELNVGSPVVHNDHGIGRYQGLITLDVNDKQEEFLLIEYAESDKLYVPVSQLHCISRYSGMDSINAPLHRLGGPEWDSIKRKAAKRAHDVAAELLQLYALRATRHREQFKIDNALLARFSAEFPFTETPDQQTAIGDVIADLQSEKPMDRLVCGDVGFGKTEVAMRAAFICATSGKQVAVLVPTTLLAGQHYQTFTDRFAAWPINIGILSRLSTAKEQHQTRQQLADGQIDIIIGTHKLLQSEISFKQLQLVILDEEHRFGVRQKERLKALRAEVDLLSLTATPIPRTLNMAMAGVRDLSIISTPPAKRLAIRTFVHEYDANRIKEAIQREMMRGGQVFYLHNNIDTIQATVTRLQDLLPQAKIALAHGQMRERELESVMTAFYHHQFNILVCTTIIETGIDIPTANTMVIERADTFGLAQLHQLRGRVGRSHHQAYAYLITPPAAALTHEAQQRLDAIAQFDDLNVGFSLATLDLEIRGAGDFLGEGQSGHIEEIGFTLYQELLDKAIQQLKSGHAASATGDTPIELNLPLSTLIPDDLIPDVHTRLVLYKRLADLEQEAEVDDFESELVDRFGALPKPTTDLIALTRLKLQCQHWGIRKIDIGHQYGRIEFTDNTRVEPATLIRLIQRHANTYQLAGQNSLRFRLPNATKAPPSVFNTLADVFTALMPAH